MSEKMYARLLRLYPSKFRKEYEGEALQLIRDRLHHETGFFKRARLWWDLVADVCIGLPLTYRNAYAMTDAASLSPNAAGVPSFKVLDSEPIGHASILLGSTLSLASAVAFGFLLSRPVDHFPVSHSEGRTSPIESVMERLNQPPIPDTPASEGEEGSEFASAALSAAARVPDSDAAALWMASNEHSPHLEEAPNTPAHMPDNAQQFGLGESAVLSRDSKGVMEHDQSLVPLQPPPPEDAFRAMIRLFDTHDIVVFGEVHDSEQEDLWLCKLVNTPGFSEHVDDVVVESGNALDQKTVDRYVDGEDVPFDEVQKAWRNVMGDVPPVSPEYGWLYKAVREANVEHPGKRRIRLLMGGPPANWDKIKSSADLAPYLEERERWYARTVKTEVLAKHHRALLIMDAGQFLRGHSEGIATTLDVSKLHAGYVERELRAAGAHPYLVVFGTNAIGNHGEADR